MSGADASMGTCVRTVEVPNGTAQRVRVLRADGATYAEIKAQLRIGSDTLARILGTSGPKRRTLSSEDRERY